MDNEENNEAKNTSTGKSGITEKNKDYTKILIAFFLGAVIATLVASIGLKILADNIHLVIISFTVALILLGTLALVFLLYKETILKKAFGVDDTDLSHLNKNTTQIIKGLTEKDYLKAAQPLGEITSKLSAKYTWITYRNWVISVFQALFIVFGGLLGSVLVYNQNELIKKENWRLDQQTHLQEAERRSSSVFYLSTVTEAIDRELKADSNRYFSPQLIGNISSFSYRLKPYRFLEGDSLIKEPISPERGQLLTTLVYSDLEDLTYQEIYKRSNFENSDLNNSLFSKIPGQVNNLQYQLLFEGKMGPHYYRKDSFIIKKGHVNMSGLNLKGSQAKESIFYNTHFYGSNLDKIDFTKSKMTLSKLRDVKANNTILDSTTLVKASLSGEFKGASFKGAKLNGARIASMLFHNEDSDLNIVESELNCVRIEGAHIKTDSLKQYDKAVNLLEESYVIFEGTDDYGNYNWKYSYLLSKNFYKSVEKEASKFNVDIKQMSYGHFCTDPNYFHLKKVDSVGIIPTGSWDYELHNEKWLK